MATSPWRASALNSTRTSCRFSDEWSHGLGQVMIFDGAKHGLRAGQTRVTTHLQLAVLSSLCAFGSSGAPSPSVMIQRCSSPSGRGFR
jgi:hypothetical protein